MVSLYSLLFLFHGCISSFISLKIKICFLKFSSTTFTYVSCFLYFDSFMLLSLHVSGVPCLLIAIQGWATQCWLEPVCLCWAGQACWLRGEGWNLPILLRHLSVSICRSLRGGSIHFPAWWVEAWQFEFWGLTGHPSCWVLPFQCGALSAVGRSVELICSFEC